MKIAAAEALAAVAREPVAGHVRELYPEENLVFGRNYVIPKPFDRRLFVEISYEVAQAAVKSGAGDAAYMEGYRRRLEQRNGTRGES